MFHYIVIILLKLKTSHFCLEVEKGHQHNVLCCDGKRSLVFDIPLVDFPSNKESHCVFSVRRKNILFSNKKWSVTCINLVICSGHLVKVHIWYSKIWTMWGDFEQEGRGIAESHKLHRGWSRDKGSKEEWFFYYSFLLVLILKL